MDSPLWRSFALAIAIVAAGPQAADASEIFSTFGPGGMYSTNNYMPVNFYTQPEVIGTELAFGFVVPGPGDWQLQGIEIAASWTGTKENARFSLYGDDAGAPAGAPMAPLGDNPPALAEYPNIAVLTLNAPLPATLTHGLTYWLSIAPASLDTSVPADDFVMLWMSLGAKAMQTSRVWFGADPWQPWYTPAFEDAAPAFRVLASPQPVPVPGALPLMAGALFAGYRARRRLRA